MTDGDTSRTLTLAELGQASFGSPLGPDIWLYEGQMTADINQFYPVRFDALLVVMVHSGVATMQVDVGKYRLEPNSMGFLRPGSYLTGFEAEGEEPLVVTVLGCTERLEDRIATTLDDIQPLLIKGYMDPVMKLKPGSTQALTPYIDLLKVVAANSTDNGNLSRKAACIFKAAIYEIIDRRVTDSSSNLSGRNREITAHFLYLLGRNFRLHRDVEFYASQMSITPKHLSAVLKAVYGTTASDWIEDYVVREAKILLCQTSLSIKEISLRLNFTSQAFFGKYFRNATGIPPTEFRRQHKS